MSRLTEYQKAQKWLECFDWDNEPEACDNLATIYEALQEMERMKDKQEQGLLISVPCKMGDSLYQKRKDGMHEYRVIGLVYDIINKEWLLEVITKVRSEWIKTVCSMDCVGKTSFLTEAEAEEALAKMGGK